jgi:hypothetical protein
MLGMHKRQGDQAYTDRAISIEVMFGSMKGFEKSWEMAGWEENEESSEAHGSI